MTNEKNMHQKSTNFYMVYFQSSPYKFIALVLRKAYIKSVAHAFYTYSFTFILQYSIVPNCREVVIAGVWGCVGEICVNTQKEGRSF